MKKALILSITISMILMIAVFLTLSSMKTSGVGNEIQIIKTDSTKKSCCTGQTNGEVSENSIYQLESKWKTESGAQIQLRDLKGKKQIMAMVFTTCTYACPLIVNDMKKIESRIKSSDVNFLLISIDPKRDTPEALKKYAADNKLNPNKWKLLTADESSVTELAAVLGFKYKQEQDGSYSHSNIINVLNENGEVAYQHFGLNQDVQDVLDYIKKKEL